MRKVLLAFGVVIVIAGGGRRGYLLAAHERRDAGRRSASRARAAGGEAGRDGALGARRARDARRARGSPRGRTAAARARLAADQDRTLRNSGAGQPGGNPAASSRKGAWCWRRSPSSKAGPSPTCGARSRHIRSSARRCAARAIAEVMAAIGHAGEHPEGRFFPDTYRFAADTIGSRSASAGVSQDGRGARERLDCSAPRHCRWRTPTKRSRSRPSSKRKPGSRASGRASPVCSSRACAETCGCRPTRP